MPNADPPTRTTATPNTVTYPAGTRLWRVHHRRWSVTSFNPRPADDKLGGGRFDGTPDDPYPFYYAGLDAGTALAESFLRRVRFDASGVRRVRRPQVKDRRIGYVETTAELTLVSLRDGPDLAAVAQDTWLIQAEAAEFPDTRRWASWIRTQAPKAQGLVWPSKREGSRLSVVLFGDQCPDDPLTEDPSWGIDLDGVMGAVFMNAMLAPYRAAVAEPRPQIRT